MKKMAGFITIFVIFIVTVASFSKGEELSSPSSSQGSSEDAKSAKKKPDLIDKTNVQDPALKKILQQIEEKLAGINEYSYVVQASNIVNNREIAHYDERCFRRPNLFFSKLTQTKHIFLDMIGSITYCVVDGKNLWRYVQNAPGSGQKMINRIDPNHRLPLAEIQKLIKRHETPKIYKYNLKRLQQAGYSAEDIARSGTLLKPFGQCYMATLKLDRQDASGWVFVAKPNIPMMGISLLRLTINKKDGILRKVEFLGAQGKVLSTQSISNVRLNPDLSKTFFTFSPPAGIEIKDDTEDIIQSLRSQGIQPKAQPAVQ